MFDTRVYLKAHPEIADPPVNALIHYITRNINFSKYFYNRDSHLSNPNLAPLIERKSISFSLIMLGGSSESISKTLESLKCQQYVLFELIATSIEAQGTLTQSDLFYSYSQAQSVDAALSLAAHDYVIILDAGDVLSIGALAALADCIVAAETDIIYSDEIFSFDGKALVPSLKPKWSPDLLNTYNYFGRLTAIRRTTAIATRPIMANNSAWEWIFNLKAAELAEHIDHLPKILCQRSHSNKLDREKALRHRGDYERALVDYWLSIKRDPHIESHSDGTFHVKWPPATRPLVSVIILHRSHIDVLRSLIDGLTQKTDYPEIEIVIVGKKSRELDATALREQFPGCRMKIVKGDDGANCSKALNLGFSAAVGQLLLFLRDDFEIIEKDWLDILVKEVSEASVGVVGPKLLRADGRIQSAGIGFGLLPLCSDMFVGGGEHDWGVFGSPSVPRTVTAVSGDCQLVQRSVFELVGGYDEDIPHSRGSALFCVNAGRFGFRSVYAARAVLARQSGAHDEPMAPLADVLLAKRLRALGLDEDPFLHPDLDAQSSEPRLREHWPELGTIDLPRVIEQLAGPHDLSQSVDLFDDGMVADVAEVPWSDVIWRFNTRQLMGTPSCGARILIELLRRRPDLRARFPRALTDGKTGGFADWARTEGIRLLGLPGSYATCVDAAFEANPGGRARQFLIYESDFRSKEPLFLLPNGRAATCRRLFEAVTAGLLTLEETWWFLLVCNETPLDELCFTWAITPLWQAAVPDGTTVFGIVDLVRWVSETFGIESDWLFEPYAPSSLNDTDQIRLGFHAREIWRERFPDAFRDQTQAQALLNYQSTRGSRLPSVARDWARARDVSKIASDLPKTGANILGHFSYPSGLRISAESIVEGLRLNDVPLSLRDVPVRFGTDEPIAHSLLGTEIYDTTIIHVQPQPLFNHVYERSGLEPRAERTYRIGYWYWEFDEPPSDWNRAALSCDEFWTATDFIADGIRKKYRQPVRVLCPGVEIPPFEPLSRSYFGLPDNEFLFLFAFHMTSVMERKNPLGLIQAFRQAFRADDRVKLVIKTAFGREHPEAFGQLHQAAAESGVILIDETFTRQEMLGLMAVCDVYVSLHRSEGLGLSMAEAMLLGKPVVATRYSGNLEFMNDRNSLLVDTKLITLDRDLPPYGRGLRWGEPSGEHAATLMRKLYDDRAFGHALGTVARADLAQTMTYRLSGCRMAARLAEIAAMP